MAARERTFRIPLFDALGLLRLMPLRSKVLLRLALFIVIPYLLLSTLVFWMALRITEKEVVDEYTRELNRGGEGYNLRLNDLYQRSNLVITNMAINSLVSPQFFMDIQKYQFDVYTIYLINKGISALESDMDRPTVDTSCITLFLTGYRGYRGRYLEALEALPAVVHEVISAGEISDSEWRYTLRPKESQRFVSLFRNVTSLTGMDSILEVRLPYRFFRKAFDALALPEGGVLAHRDRTGRVLSVIPEDRRAMLDRTRRTHRLVSTSPIVDGSTLTLVFPTVVVWKRLQAVYLLLTVGLVLLMAAILYAITRTTSRITGRLTDFVRRLGRDVLSSSGPPHAADRVPDEIDVLEGTVLSLVEQLTQAHRDIVDMQSSKNLLELELLQSRLNPHLLYNSLGVVKWSAMRTNDRRTVEIVDALTDYYRRVLARGENVTTVEEELASIAQYLRIVNLTHAQEYRLEVDVDRAMLPTPILKHVLQPLVENAVLHGLKGKAGESRVKVTGTMEDGDLVFAVSDNGFGIPPDTIGQIMSMSYTSKYGGYGLKNSMRRIQSYYGDGYGLRIESQPGKGTTVRVRIRAESGQRLPSRHQ